MSFSALAGAAEISFSDDNKITGELVAMDVNGSITLNTAYSEQPLKIRVEKVQKIDFANPTKEVEKTPQNITLVNGDKLFVVIKSLDDQILKMTSPVLGDLDIPRDKIDSIQSGLFSQTNLYNGPKEIGEWQSTQDQIMNWKCEDNQLTAVGSGSIQKDFKLPENYSIRFKLSWKFNPNFKFSFSDPLTPESQAADRYYIQFGRAGLELKRESIAGNRYTTIAVINRSPDEYENNEMWIEIRVNRKNGRLDLHINNELAGKYIDPARDFPKGNGVVFTSLSRQESDLSISEIEVKELTGNNSKSHTEDRGATKEDALIGRNSERFGGKLLSISEVDQLKVYRFKSNFQEEPIDLPESEVSTIFLARTNETKPKSIDGMNLLLQGGGFLTVTKSTFHQNTLVVTHPLLGEIQIDRSAVIRLERRPTNPSNRVTKP